MTSARVLFGLLIAATISVDVWVAALPPTNSPSIITSLAILGFVLGQVGFATAWCTLGKYKFLARLLLPVLAICGLSGVLTRIPLTPSYSEWLGIFGVYATGVLLPLLGIRLTGQTLTAGADDSLATRLTKQWQFTIGGLLSATTAICIVVALVRLTSFPWEQAFVIFSYIVAFVAVTLFALWLAWGKRRIWLRMVTFLSISIPAVFFVQSLESGGSVTTATFLCMGGYVVAAATVIRIAGYGFDPAIADAKVLLPKHAARMEQPARLLANDQNKAP